MAGAPTGAEHPSSQAVACARDSPPTPWYRAARAVCECDKRAGARIKFGMEIDCTKTATLLCAPGRLNSPVPCGTQPCGRLPSPPAVTHAWSLTCAACLFLSMCRAYAGFILIFSAFGTSIFGYDASTLNPAALVYII